MFSLYSVRQDATGPKKLVGEFTSLEEMNKKVKELTQEDVPYYEKGLMLFGKDSEGGHYAHADSDDLCENGLVLNA